MFAFSSGFAFNNDQLNLSGHEKSVNVDPIGTLEGWLCPLDLSHEQKNNSRQNTRILVWCSS